MDSRSLRDWRVVALGLVTSDSFAGLHALLVPSDRRPPGAAAAVLASLVDLAGSLRGRGRRAGLAAGESRGPVRT